VSINGGFTDGDSSAANIANLTGNDATGEQCDDLPGFQNDVTDALNPTASGPAWAGVYGSGAGSGQPPLTRAATALRTVGSPPATIRAVVPV
jgi:hypothetical protein